MLGVPEVFAGSLWARIDVADTNIIVVVRLVLDSTRSIYLTSEGLLRESISGSGRILGQFAAPPRDRWFEVGFELDLIGRAGTFEVDGEPQAFALDSSGIADELRGIDVGPAEPNPENAAGGWSILYDDVIIR